MARFSLSVLTVFLVLAAFALSMPTQDNANAFDTTLNDMKAPAAAPIPQDNGASNSPAPRSEEKVSDADTDHPPSLDKDPYSGKFATPTTPEAPAKTSVQPNALGGIPILGPILGGEGLL